MNINVFRYHVKIAKPMNQPEIEQHILNAAIGAIHREAGLRLDIVASQVRRDRCTIDAIVQIHKNGARLTAEVKKWVTQANVGAIINQLHNLAEPG